jgi:hypothetical protein
LAIAMFIELCERLRGYYKRVETEARIKSATGEKTEKYATRPKYFYAASIFFSWPL